MVVIEQNMFKGAYAVYFADYGWQTPRLEYL